MILKKNNKVHSLRWKMTLAFSAITGMILLANFFLFNVTLHFTEDEVSNRRLAFLSDFAISEYQKGFTGVLPLDHLTSAYDSYESLPEDLRNLFDEEWKGSEDFRYDFSPEKHATLLATTMTIDGQKRPLYIVEDNERITMSDMEEWFLQFGVIIYSLLLLAGTWLVIHRIAGRLASPFQLLATEIEQSKPDNLSPMSTLTTNTEEQVLLIEALNNYRQRIKQSIERERSFSRYVSHELRTPITVISGVATLLEVSREPAAIDKQIRRLEKACQNMTDITETLLSLVREKPFSPYVLSTLDEDFIEQLVEDHKQLLLHKPVTATVEASDSIQLNAPDTILRILLGNIVKNAFSYTQQGQVMIRLTDKRFEVIDTGPGLGTNVTNQDSHGLGLLIVKDICHQHNWPFIVENRDDETGCIASVDFSSK